MQTSFPCGKGIMSKLPGTVHVESGKPGQRRLPRRDATSAFGIDPILAASLSRYLFSLRK